MIQVMRSNITHWPVCSFHIELDNKLYHYICRKYVDKTQQLVLLFDILKLFSKFFIIPQTQKSVGDT